MYIYIVYICDISVVLYLYFIVTTYGAVVDEVVSIVTLIKILIIVITILTCDCFLYCKVQTKEFRRQEKKRRVRKIKRVSK